MKNVPVFFHSSDEFCPYLSVCMISILFNTKSFVEFYVIETEISDFRKRQIEGLKERFPNFSIKWIKFEHNDIFKKEYFDGLKKENSENKPWPSVHGFCTPFMPLLAPEIDKLIYLDLDTIVLGDIQKFYDEDIDGYALGAVPDIVVPLFMTDEGIALNRNINFLEFGKYFNAGVLLVNAKKFRDENLIQDYFNIAHTEIVPSCDQDVLNRLFQNGGFKPLDLKYNFIYPPSQEMLDQKGIKATTDIFEIAKHDTIIRHFAGDKPWNDTKEHLTGKALLHQYEFWFFTQMSPFYEGISKNFTASQATRVDIDIFQSLNSIKSTLQNISLHEKQPTSPCRVLMYRTKSFVFKLIKQVVHYLSRKRSS